MISFLYDVFVYNYALGKTSLKFEKIKNLLRDENQPSQLYPFYELLRMGLIDKVDENSYGLTASKIYSDSKGDYSLGVNLPASFLKENPEKVYSQYLGLTVFKDINWMDNPYNVVFNLDNYTHQFQPLKKIIKEWKPIDLQNFSSYVKLQKFDPLKNDWRNVKLYEEDTALYKRFIHNDAYFEYLLVFANRYYEIKPYETEKILFIRLVLTNKTIFTLDSITQILSVEKSITLPNFIYKTLFITHVLNKGEIPAFNQFCLNKKQVNQILKPLKLSYTIL